MHNKKGNRQTSFLQLFHKLVFERGYGQRRQRRKRETNVIETRKNEEKKRDNRWTNLWAKGHTEVTHAWKKWEVEEIFFLIQKEGEIVVQKNGDQENKNKSSNEKEMKKWGEMETWWTKTRSDQIKDGSKTCKEEKHRKCNYIVHYTHQVTFWTGLESHYIDLPLWIPNRPSVRVFLLG